VAQVPDLNFRSSDGRFGLRVEPPQVARLLSLCAASEGRETGGVLVGRYASKHDLALVSSVVGPPADSRGGRTWFHRGVHELQSLLDRIWRGRREYYLGEWHFHPGAAPEPSSTDFATMSSISLSTEWRCPEPVLLIIGGDPSAEWCASAMVTTRAGQRILLLPSWCSFCGHALSVEVS
jgi:integrative and conjugative element protein (TIGR02256 family)